MEINYQETSQDFVVSSEQMRTFGALMATEVARMPKKSMVKRLLTMDLEFMSDLPFRPTGYGVENTNDPEADETLHPELFVWYGFRDVEDSLIGDSVRSLLVEDAGKLYPYDNFLQKNISRKSLSEGKLRYNSGYYAESEARVVELMNVIPFEPQDSDRRGQENLNKEQLKKFGEDLRTLLQLKRYRQMTIVDTNHGYVGKYVAKNGPLFGELVKGYFGIE